MAKTHEERLEQRNHKLAKLKAKADHARERASFLHSSHHGNSDGGVRIFLGIALAALSYAFAALKLKKGQSIDAMEMTQLVAFAALGAFIFAWGARDAFIHTIGAASLEGKVNKYEAQARELEAEIKAEECREDLESSTPGENGQRPKPKRL